MSPDRLSRMVSFAVVVVTSIAAAAPAQQGAPGGQKLTPDQMDKLTAPVALYPDALIIQIAQCSTSPYQVKQVNEWLKKNPDLKGSAAQDAAAKQGFDASFVAIVLFPQVLQMMTDQPDWTRQIGQAFNEDKDGLFASIQRLRAQAQKLGNLQTTPQQEVKTVTADGGTQVIVIQPANPQVVYVPVYNPQVVYTQPAPAPAPTTTTQKSDDGKVVAAALIGFAAGVIVGAAADDDDHHYYYSYGGWAYTRPICYPGGYNNYYQHRENMASDYYKHRENMANDYYDHRENMNDQRGQNQSGRQDQRGESQAGRQDQRGENQATRNDQQGQNQATRDDQRGQNQSGRQDSRSQNQGSRQDTAGEYQGRATTTSRGSFDGSQQRPASSSGSGSGAFSSYQRGSTERDSASRGRSSMSSGGGGGGGSFGGFSGGRSSGGHSSGGSRSRR